MTTQALNLRLGSAPDSWGVWFPEDDRQLPYERFLDELAGSGYEWLELGPYGYLPTDPAVLADEVGKRGLKVSGGTVFGNLHRPRKFEDDHGDSSRKVAELTASPGREARRVHPAPVPRREDRRDQRRHRMGRRAVGLGSCHARTASASRMFEEYGVTIALHPHADMPAS